MCISSLRIRWLTAPGKVHFMRGKGKAQVAGGHLKGLQQRKDALLLKLTDCPHMH